MNTIFKTAFLSLAMVAAPVLHADIETTPTPTHVTTTTTTTVATPGIWERFMHGVERVGQVIKDGIKSVVTHIKNGWEKLTGTTHEVAHDVAIKAEETEKTAHDAIKDAATDIKEKAHDIEKSI